MANVATRRGEVVHDPLLVQKLLGDPRFGWLWLLPRLWLGLQWLQSGLSKLSNPRWADTGEALKGFWMSAIRIPDTGRPSIAYDWYRLFIEALLNGKAYTWFAKLVVAGELLVGIALILGAFTGIAALLGGFMNWNFMMAGTASVNPVFFVTSVGLILAWKVSGYIGADYFLLPWIGTPWGSAPAAPSRQPAEARS